MWIPFLKKESDNDFRMEAACCNHIGRKRRNNEDNFYFHGQMLPLGNQGLSEKIYTMHSSTKEGHFFAVFDGMGGQDHGEMASYMAAKVFTGVVEEEIMPKEHIAMTESLEQMVHQMNQRVFEEAQKTFSSMGTTVAMVYLWKDGMTVCNVGDSKVLLFSGKELRQLSKDHTDELFLKTHGIVNRKPVLTQYLGANPDELLLEPLITTQRVQRGDCILLCSDGLTEMLSMESIHHILETHDTAKGCVTCLRQEALAQGGLDNITVIVIKVR